MRKIAHTVDRPLMLLVILLVVSGFFIFTSASLGLLAKNGGARFASTAIDQLLLGVFLGGVAGLIMSHIHYRAIRPFTLYVFVFTIILTALVFVPGLGLTAGGATRWIIIGSHSFQPAEFLKLGVILYLATYLAHARSEMHSWKIGLLPFLLILAIPAAVLLAQPDTSTLVVIAAAACAMYFNVGARWRDIGILFVIGLLSLSILALSRDYVRERIVTFIHPTHDERGSSYQINQSLIAIGSGKVTGRGFGQSIQKFGYLPEPTGDSVYAVAAEEFGFLGSVFIIGLFVALALRLLYLSTRVPDYFGALVLVGIGILITAQAFINISSMLGVIPLTGLPLPFISHGGSALFTLLLGVGIALNISRYAK